MPEDRETPAPEVPGSTSDIPDTPAPVQEGQSAPEMSAEEEQTARTQQSRRRGYAFQYIAILFAAAFVLLFFTYMMERRQYEQREQQYEQKEQQDAEQIENLNKESISAVQSIKDLYAENESLANRVEELEGLLEQAQADSATARQTADAKEQILQRTRIAMDWFWQLDEAYVRNRYTLCREIIQTMEDNPADPLVGYLSTESATDNRRFSPYDRYMEIRDAVL